MTTPRPNRDRSHIESLSVECALEPICNHKSRTDATRISRVRLNYDAAPRRDGMPMTDSVISHWQRCLPDLLRLKASFEREHSNPRFHILNGDTQRHVDSARRRGAYQFK